MPESIIKRALGDTLRVNPKSYIQNPKLAQIGQTQVSLDMENKPFIGFRV